MLKLFILVIFSICFANAAERSNILVKKEILAKEIVVGEEFPVRISVYNVGTSTAHSVQMEDKAWENQYFAPSIGINVAHWEKLAPGSEVSHIFYVKPNYVGRVDGGAAKVTYLESQNGKERTGYSLSVGTLEILARGSGDDRADPLFVEWGQFLGLSAASVSLPFLIWVWVQKNYIRGMRKQKAQ